MGDEKNVSAYAEEDAKKLKQLKVAYPAQQLGGGVEKAYISTYISYLYTNIYVMPVAFSGLITIIQNIVGWIGGPLFGTIIDTVQFKKGKYYPWMIIGSFFYYGGWLLIYCVPAFGIRGSQAAVLALIIGVINACISPLVTVPQNAVYPLMSTDAGDRQYFAMMQKICRDGGKTIFSYIFPILLPAIALAFSNGAAEATAEGEAISYAICAVIACVAPIAGFIYYALCLKGSYVERNAMAKSAGAAKKKGVSLGVMFRIVFANRALLSMYLFMSLHKAYYFIYVTSAAYMFKYVWGDFSKMGIFMTMFNLTAIIGVMGGPIWKKIFKETKRCFVSNMALHVVLLAVLAVTFKSLSLTAFMVIFALSSCLMGMLENYVLPMFAAASDYGAWKTGERMDGLTMSIYSLTIKTGTLVSTTVRTAVLVAANLDAITAGGEVTADFISKLSFLYSWIPLGLGVAALLVLMFLFNLDDNRIKLINDDLKAGITAATSQNKL